MPPSTQNITTLSRNQFDAVLTSFRSTLEKIIRTSPQSFPFLESTLGSVLSLRYHDRIYLDLCAFSRHLAPQSRILDLGTGSGIIGYGVIEHIPDGVLPGVMKEVARVTKPGGGLMISYLPRQWALMEIVLGMMGRLHHLRRWGDGELRRFLEDFGYELVLLERIIFAPQFPASFANRHKSILDRFDVLAKIPPFSLVARDLMGVARKKES